MYLYIGYPVGNLESMGKWRSADCRFGVQSNWRWFQIQRSRVSCYGDAIRRTGMGEVPAPPMTGVAPLSLLLQPEMLSTVMLMLPGSGGPGPGFTWLMKACMYPTTVTAPGLGGRGVLSIMGMVTMELDVVTRLPVWRPLSALIFIGLPGHGLGSRGSWRLLA